ncbi:MAG: hypothetical protein JW912_02585 [Sedimentisphaerales bacterium]|nr:hypothetical protein [Sedimentisphaerales bacterium]
MLMSISKEELVALTAKQLENLFGLDKKKEFDKLEGGIYKALEKTEYCFSFNITKYYQKDGSVFFNPFNSSQYTTFLYFLCKVLSQQNSNLLADKVYYLNKTLNNVDLYYEIDLPEIFGLDHALGTVLGRATYSNFFHFSQNCRVGNNHCIYPSFEENIIMLADSTVIGDSHIGHNCIISANTYIKDQDIPDYSLVFGATPNLTIKKIDDSYFRKYSNFNDKKE